MLEVIGLILLFTVLVTMGPVVGRLLCAIAVCMITGALFALFAAMLGFSINKAFVVGVVMVALLGLGCVTGANQRSKDKTNSAKNKQ